MGQINLSNSKGRDAMVGTVAVRKQRKVRYLDDQQRQAQSVRILKSTLDRDIDALTRQAGGIEGVADKLIQSDAEIDAENFGRFLKETSRVFVDPDGKVVHKIKQFEVVRNPDGSERERRPRKIAPPNAAVEMPLKWTGKLIKKSEVYNKFVIANKQQIVHVNGLTYDFLFGIAKELEEKDSLMLVGAGPKGTNPLVFTRGGQAYRGFLEGKTQGDKYCLVLHLANQELKAPPPQPETQPEEPKKEESPPPAEEAKPKARAKKSPKAKEY